MDEERIAGRKALGKVRKPKVPKEAVKNKQTKTNRAKTKKRLLERWVDPAKPHGRSAETVLMGGNSGKERKASH